MESLEIFGDIPVLPNNERIQLAYEAWVEAKGALSVREAAVRYGVAYSILRGVKVMR